MSASTIQTDCNYLFPTRLRTLMQERRQDTNKKTSQDQLATAIGVAQQTVSDYINGTIAPDCYRAAAIAKYFNVSVDYLLGISDARTQDSTVQAICTATGLSDAGLKYVEQYHKVLSFLAEHRKVFSSNGKYADVLALIENIVVTRDSNKKIAFDNKGDATIESIENVDKLTEWQLDKASLAEPSEHVHSQQASLTDLTLQFYKYELSSALDAIRSIYQDESQDI